MLTVGKLKRILNKFDDKIPIALKEDYYQWNHNISKIELHKDKLSNNKEVRIWFNHHDIE